MARSSAPEMQNVVLKTPLHAFESPCVNLQRVAQRRKVPLNPIVALPAYGTRRRELEIRGLGFAGFESPPKTDSASMAAPLSIEALLSRSAGDLGISPTLTTWWSGDLSAAAPQWFAQEADLRAAYTKCAPPSMRSFAHSSTKQCKTTSSPNALALYVLRKFTI